MNFNENDVWREETNLLNFKLSKLARAKVFLKLEFDTEDQVLFVVVFVSATSFGFLVSILIVGYLVVCCNCFFLCSCCFLLNMSAMVATLDAVFVVVLSTLVVVVVLGFLLFVSCICCCSLVLLNSGLVFSFLRFVTEGIGWLVYTPIMTTHQELLGSNISASSNYFYGWQGGRVGGLSETGNKAILASIEVEVELS